MKTFPRVEQSRPNTESVVNVRALIRAETTRRIRHSIVFMRVMDKVMAQVDEQLAAIESM